MIDRSLRSQLGDYPWAILAIIRLPWTDCPWCAEEVYNKNRCTYDTAFLNPPLQVGVAAGRHFLGRR